MEKDKELAKVAIYIRVSTEDQAREGYSLSAQTDKLRAYCTARDWKIQGIYEDPGFSGRNIKRPGYTDMLSNINNWDGILVYKMDRIHRNTRNFLTMMSELEKHHKEFISSQESLDTSTAMGRFVMQIIQSIAQLESEQISERVTVAQIQKMKKTTEFMGHNCPYGYKMVKDKITPVDDELQNVKRIFDLYNQGYSMRACAVRTGLSNTNIRYWLQNPCYSGFERWKRWYRKASYYKKIIPINTFNKTQNLIRSKAKKNQKKIVLQLKDQDLVEIPRIKAIKISFMDRPKQHPL